MYRVTIETEDYIKEYLYKLRSEALQHYQELYSASVKDEVHIRYNCKDCTTRYECVRCVRYYD